MTYKPMTESERAEYLAMVDSLPDDSNPIWTREDRASATIFTYPDRVMTWDLDSSGQVTRSVTVYTDGRPTLTEAFQPGGWQPYPSPL